MPVVVIVILIGAASALWLWIFHHQMRRLEPGWQAVVSTVAGGGVPGAAPQSPYAIHFSDPFGVAAAADGTIYVADGVGAHRIYRITTTGVATIVAGSKDGFADGRGEDARFSTPSGLVLDVDGTW